MQIQAPALPSGAITRRATPEMESNKKTGKHYARLDVLYYSLAGWQVQQCQWTENTRNW